eukprot:6174954-Pleurochrysis_carterae.AAC.4
MLVGMIDAGLLSPESISPEFDSAWAADVAKVRALRKYGRPRRKDRRGGALAVGLLNDSPDASDSRQNLHARGLYEGQNEPGAEYAAEYCDEGYYERIARWQQSSREKS